MPVSRLARGCRNRVHVDAASAAIKAHRAVHEREDRVVATEADIPARLELRPALADEDVAGDDALAAEFFHAEPLADAVAAVLDASLTFLVSHKSGVLSVGLKLAVDAGDLHLREPLAMADGAVVALAALVAI